MKMASHQGVMGVAFAGVERLPREQMPPIEVIMDWSAVVDYIERENLRLNQTCVRLVCDFQASGMKACVLKGAGMGTFYPNPLRRSVGDIDLWMAGGRKKIETYVGQHFDHVDMGDGGRHVAFSLDGVEVEVHYTPAVLYNPLHHRRLKAYFAAEEALPWNHCVEVELEHVGKGSVVIPSHEFNLVFILVHFFHHWVYEGIGMKQLLDYYWLTLAASQLEKDVKARVVDRLHHLGLGAFLAAVMSIFKTLGMDEKLLLCPPDDRRGSILLQEMLEIGNVTADDLLTGRFGNETLPQRFIRRLRRSLHILSLAPAEVPFVLLRSIFCWLKRGSTT